MSRIDELVERLCPDGVAYRPLGEVATLVRGNGMPKKMLTDSGVGAIHYGQIYTHYGAWTDATRSFVSPQDAMKLARVDPGNVVVTNTSENLEDVGKAVAWMGDDQIVTGGHATVVKHSMNPKFLSYWFQTPSFAKQKRVLATGTKVIDVSARSLSTVVVPVPPLEVQSEVVRVLDCFTSLETELEAELEARKGQLEYYSELLVSGVSIGSLVRLGEVASIARGASPRPIRSFVTESDDGVPWIRIGDVPPDGKYISETSQKIIRAGAEKSRVVRPGDFVLSNSMSFGRPYIVGIEGCVHDGWLVISNFEAHFIPEFLYYALRSRSVQAQFEQRAGSGTVRNLNSEIVREVVLPCPDLGLQRRIVDTLGEFADLANSLSIGLPAEIAARRQQYEYYRDRLLTFKEKAS